jgi:hypothetical protein
MRTPSWLVGDCVAVGQALVALLGQNVPIIHHSISMVPAKELNRTGVRPVGMCLLRADLGSGNCDSPRPFSFRH